MNIKNFKWHNGYLAIIGVGGIFTFLGIHFRKQYNLLNNTSFKPAGFAINKLNLDQVDFNIKFKMGNQSAVDYYLSDQSYNLYINGTFAATIKNPNKIYVAPEKSTDIWLNVKFNPLNVQNLSWLQIKDLLLKNSNLPIQLKGSASVKTLNGIVSFNYPVDETFTMKDLTS